jgi:hypothetical protein
LLYYNETYNSSIIWIFGLFGEFQIQFEIDLGGSSRGCGQRTTSLFLYVAREEIDRQIENKSPEKKKVLTRVCRAITR